MQTMQESFTSLTVADLKNLVSLFPNTPKPTPTRKDKLLEIVLAEMADEKLPLLWEKLDEGLQMAIAEACHNTGGFHIPSSFSAKHSKFADFSPSIRHSRYEVSEKTKYISLFFHYWNEEYVLPTDLQAKLRAFVPKPAKNLLHTLEAAPPLTILDRDDEPVELVIRHTEVEAITDLTIVLRSIERGKLSASAKTQMPSSSSQHTLAALLTGGDFYEYQPKKDKWDQEIGPIKAFAWPLLLQAGGLAQVNGSKLALTPAGSKALSAAPEKTLRALWKKWLKSSILDEFSRIEVIKGQKSSGRVMSAVPARREVLQEALKHCPVNTWLTLEELMRYMRAEGMPFTVCHEPWKLYICDANYGSLGYGGTSLWDFLQKRYAMCLLLEYCASLGMIDVGLVHPSQVEADFGGTWGMDDMEFLSQYDGLLYFRLNPLGAYCLELTDQYQAAKRLANVNISVQPNLSFNILSGELALADKLMLENWATAETPQSWRLDKVKTLSAFERGQDSTEILEFLQQADSQELPQQIEHFFAQGKAQGRALKVSATCLLIECSNSQIAEQIASHPETKAICLRTGEKHLVVKLELEAKFRNAVRLVGFGILL